MSKVDLRLESIARNEHTDHLQVNYTVMQWGNPLCLTFSISLKETMKGFEANVSFDGCEKPTAEEAIRKLGEWCGRAAEALADVKLEKSIPIGNSKYS